MRRLVAMLCLNLLLCPISFATTLTVMSFNIENGGAQVDFNKVVEAIRIGNADVVGVQEVEENIKKLADALQWPYYDKTLSIVSRYPIIHPAKSDIKYVFIEVAPGKMVAIGNMHLPDEPYGPNMINAGKSVAAALENERITRLPSALPFLNKLAVLAKNGMPVFLTGDFNSPSHLDWTKKSANVTHHHGKSVPWNVTKMASELGFKDSYRLAHPDTKKFLGYTWPAGRPFLTNNIDHFNPSATDLPDRIDFVLFGGAARVIQSNIIREPSNRPSERHVSPWPSDHAAVASTFEVTP